MSNALKVRPFEIVYRVVASSLLDADVDAIKAPRDSRKARMVVAFWSLVAVDLVCTVLYSKFSSAQRL